MDGPLMKGWAVSSSVARVIRSVTMVLITINFRMARILEYKV